MRANNIPNEISGVPTSTSDAEIGSKVCKIHEIIDNVSPTNGVKTCHRMSKRNINITIKFSRRKDCRTTLIAKKKLNNVDSRGKLKKIGIENVHIKKI